MAHQFVLWLSHAVNHWGYPGIVVFMALESSFVPVPSELVIPPAAYLAASGQMSLVMIVLCGTLGSLLGALFNYWLAWRFGRPFFERYGRYLLVSQRSLERAEWFFRRYGHVCTFFCRFLPGIRHYISLPAGLARMDMLAFCTATGLGAGLWVMVLAGLGFWFGHNEQLVLQNLRWVTLLLISGCAGVIFFYWTQRQRRARRGQELLGQ